MGCQIKIVNGDSYKNSYPGLDDALTPYVVGAFDRATYHHLKGILDPLILCINITEEDEDLNPISWSFYIEEGKQIQKLILDYGISDSWLD